MADFYRQKKRINRQITLFLLHLQEHPETWNAKAFEEFIRNLQLESGFSERTIMGEFGDLGIAYDKQQGVLIKTISAYEKMVKK